MANERVGDALRSSAGDRPTELCAAAPSTRAMAELNMSSKLRNECAASPANKARVRGSVK